MSSVNLGFVHNFIPASDPNAPTLLLLHGTGGDENDLVPLGRALRPGAALLSPRGQVLENGMPRFFRRLAEGVFDTEDVIRRSRELADFVAQAAEAYGFDPSQVIAAGFSNGANIAAATLLLHPRVLAGAVLLAPMMPLEPQERPDLTGSPVFIGAGRRDPWVGPENTERLAGLLGECGAAVTLHWHPGGHALTPDTVQAAIAWLQKTFRQESP